MAAFIALRQFLVNNILHPLSYLIFASKTSKQKLILLLCQFNIHFHSCSKFVSGVKGSNLAPQGIIHV